MLPGLQFSLILFGRQRGRGSIRYAKASGLERSDTPYVRMREDEDEAVLLDAQSAGPSSR